MAELKIKADSGSGTVSFKGPATTTDNAAVQLTLPVDDGAANQFLKTDGSGVLSWATVDTSIADDSIVEAKLDVSNAPTNGQFLQAQSGEGGGLTWATPVSGLYSSYAMVGERLAEATAAGTFTSGAYRIRIIDEEIYDPDGIVSISSNQFTLQAGTYLIWWSYPAYQVDKHHTKLYNVTDSANVAAGEACKIGSGGQTRSSGMARVTISGAKAFEIRHICADTKASNGLGENAANSDMSDNIISWVQIWKEA